MISTFQDLGFSSVCGGLGLEGMLVAWLDDECSPLFFPSLPTGGMILDFGENVGGRWSASEKLVTLHPFHFHLGHR